MIPEKKTDEVEAILKSVKPNQLKQFYRENKKSMIDDEKAFYYFMKDTMEAKNRLLKEMYAFAGPSQEYCEKILRMEKHTKSRDLIIRFCLGGHFSVEEINKALKLYGMHSLYAKDKRDACLIVAVNNRKYDLIEIDDMLTEQGLEPICAK